jgi:hypothetical protein
LVYEGLKYADLYIRHFENFLVNAFFSSKFLAEYLPPHNISLLQTMDQGVTENAEVYCLRQTFREMLREMENCNMSVKEYWMSYNININNIDGVWAEVTSTV